jgi:hypothetical protein
MADHLCCCGEQMVEIALTVTRLGMLGCDSCGAQMWTVDDEPVSPDLARQITDMLRDAEARMKRRSTTVPQLD